VTYQAHPLRLQRKRTKGFKLPEGTICVTRGTRFGNPFTLENCRQAGFQGTDDELRLRCVEAFKVWLGPNWEYNWQGEESERRRQAILDALPSLKGKQLACWCPLTRACHCDILCAMANKE
jgi:hypothetical protein